MNAHELFASPVIEQLGWMLLHSTWQLALIALTVGLAMRLGRLSARVRYGIACLGMLIMVVCPVATFFLIEVPEPDEPVAATATFAQPDFPQTEPTSDASLPPVADVEVTAKQVITAGRLVPLSTNTAEITPEPPTLRARLAGLIPWFVPPWLVGMLLLALWQLGGYYCTRRWITTAKPIEAEFLTGKLTRLAERLDVKRTIRLLQSTRVATPLVLGWLRPAILLPVELITNLPAEHWDAVLAHELAHIRRYDYLVNLLQTAAETVLFYHPGVWMVSRWIRIERELCCDDVAADVCGSPIQYAEALTRLEAYRRETAGTQTHSAVAAVDGASTVHRVRRLLGVPQKPRHGAARLAGVFAVAVVLAAVAALAGAGLEDENPGEAGENGNAQELHDRDTIVRFAGTVLDNGKPVPGAKVRVFHNTEGWSETVLADEEGHFRIVAGKGTTPQDEWILSAESPDGQRGLVRKIYKSMWEFCTLTGWVPISQDDVDPDSLTLSLEPMHTSTVTVTDEGGKPIPGADVVALYSVLPLVKGRTGADGKAYLGLFPGECVTDIAAAKSGAGLDHFSRGLGPHAPPKEVRLTLSGAVTVRVKTLDTSGRPIPGVLLRSWWLDSQIQLNYSDLVQATTNDEGIAVFDRLPRNGQGSYTLCVKGDRFVNGLISARPGPDVLDDNKVVLTRAVPITGRVTFPDGKPAVGIEVAAHGILSSPGDERVYRILTDSGGAYRLMVQPGAVYMVAVNDRDWTARPRSGIIAHENEPLQNVDLHLMRGTVIRGRVTYRGGPLDEEEAELEEVFGPPTLDEDLRCRFQGDPVVLQGEKGPIEVLPTCRPKFFSDEPDAFFFRVGPGKYRLSFGIGNYLWKPVTVNVTDQREIIRNVELRRPRRIDLRIAATLADGASAPAADVSVDVLSSSLQHQYVWPVSSATASTDEHGEVAVQCGLRPFPDAKGEGPWKDDRVLVLVSASHGNERFAGTALIRPESQKVRVVMKPAATLRGRLIDSTGASLPYARLQIAFRSTKLPKSEFVHESRALLIQSDGRFEITNLPVGLAVSVDAAMLGKGARNVVRDCPIEKPGVIDLGDVKWDGP